MEKINPAKLAKLERHGWPLSEWCREAGIGKATHYTLPEDARPKFVKIGKRRIIIEPPADWLNRMAALGGVQITKPKAA